MFIEEIECAHCGENVEVEIYEYRVDKANGGTPPTAICAEIVENEEFVDLSDEYKKEFGKDMGFFVRAVCNSCNRNFYKCGVLMIQSEAEWTNLVRSGDS